MTRIRKFKCQLLEDEAVLVAPISMLENMALLYESYSRMDCYTKSEQDVWSECGALVRQALRDTAPGQFEDE